MLDMSSLATDGLVQILLSIVFIGIAWWALQTVRWDLFLLKPNSPQGKLVVILLSIIIGSLVAQFFRNYFSWSSMLKHFF